MSGQYNRLYVTLHILRVTQDLNDQDKRKGRRDTQVCYTGWDVEEDDEEVEGEKRKKSDLLLLRACLEGDQ